MVYIVLLSLVRWRGLCKNGKRAFLPRRTTKEEKESENGGRAGAMAMAVGPCLESEVWLSKNSGRLLNTQRRATAAGDRAIGLFEMLLSGGTSTICGEVAYGRFLLLSHVNKRIVFDRGTQ